MKLALFGATGKTGGAILEKALAEGHDVSVMVRDPARLRVSHARLRVHVGAAHEPRAVAETVVGADVVISAMGAGGGALTTLGENLVPAMHDANVTRFVTLVGASVAMPGDPATIAWRMLHAITRAFAADVLADGEAHARHLATTDLAYTLVRPPRLTDGGETGRIRHDDALPLGPFSSIARRDLAAFMLQLAVDGAYVRRAPMVASARGARVDR